MKLLLLTFTGQDKPGITSKISEILSKFSTTIKDMGQTILYENLILSFLVEVSEEIESHLLSDLEIMATKLDLEINQKEIKEVKNYNVYERYILSCINTDNITPQFICDISNFLSKNKINILRIDNNSEKKFSALEFIISIKKNSTLWGKIKEDLLKIGHIHKTDMALLKDDIWLRSRRLVIFDMDSTLIKNEVIDELADELHIRDEIAHITELTMNGRIDFDESIKRRVKLLKGLSQESLKKVAARLTLNDGVEDFISTVKKLGLKTAVISGGFSYFTNYFKEKLNLDYAFSNELEIKNSVLTGNLVGKIINAEAKEAILKELAVTENINLNQVVAIGDGANDIKMLASAGLGIAYHAKEIVKKEAGQSINFSSMSSILYFLGIKSEF